MVEYLRAVSKKHSISKVKASIFLPQPIIRPDELFQELKGEHNFIRYQKKTLKKSRTIGIELHNIDFSKASEEEKVDGFIFEEYNDEGLLINFLSLQNEQNRSMLTFECRMYTTWNDFFSRFKEDVNYMSAFLKMYVEVLSLTYVDEFLWMHPSKVPVDKIFNINSELINNKFLKSENGSIILLSQNSEQKSEERTEIAFSNRLRRVSINHQYVERLNAHNISSVQELIANNIFDEKFNSAHDSNKSMLDNLLSLEVKKKIGLK